MDGAGMTGRVLPVELSWMAWVLRLVETGADDQGGGLDVLEINGPKDLRGIADLGLTLPEAK